MSASTPAILTLLIKTRIRAGKLSEKGARNPRRVHCVASILVGALLICSPVLTAQGPGQQQEPSARIPLPTKNTMGGVHRAFSGKIETVDMKRKVLIVGTVEGGASEIFPIKKGISVSGAKGKKLKLKELSPGTNVIVYYDFRDGRRFVNEIMILAVNPPEKEKKKDTPPPS